MYKTQINFELLCEIIIFHQVDNMHAALLFDTYDEPYIDQFKICIFVFSFFVSCHFFFC